MTTSRFTRLTRLFAGFGSLALLLSACSEEEPGKETGLIVVEGELQDVTISHPDLPPLAGSSSCTIETAGVTKAESPHWPECTPISYPTQPGTSGAHYPVWAAWRSYRGPIPEPYLVHNLEHGGVVLQYNCPEGCPDLMTALDGIVAAFPEDPRCTPPLRARLVVAENPDLDVPLAAAAWGQLYRATCLDIEGLSEWIGANYAKAPEDTCADGFDFALPEGGTFAPCSNGHNGTSGPSMGSRQ